MSIKLFVPLSTLSFSKKVEEVEKVEKVEKVEEVEKQKVEKYLKSHVRRKKS